MVPKRSIQAQAPGEGEEDGWNVQGQERDA